MAINIVLIEYLLEILTMRKRKFSCAEKNISSAEKTVLGKTPQSQNCGLQVWLCIFPGWFPIDSTFLCFLKISTTFLNTVVTQLYALLADLDVVILTTLSSNCTSIFPLCLPLMKMALMAMLVVQGSFFFLLF